MSKKLLTATEEALRALRVTPLSGTETPEAVLRAAFKGMGNNRELIKLGNYELTPRQALTIAAITGLSIATLFALHHTASHKSHTLTALDQNPEFGGPGQAWTSDYVNQFSAQDLDTQIEKAQQKLKNSKSPANQAKWQNRLALLKAEAAHRQPSLLAKFGKGIMSIIDTPAYAADEAPEAPQTTLDTFRKNLVDSGYQKTSEATFSGVYEPAGTELKLDSLSGQEMNTLIKNLPSEVRTALIQSTLKGIAIEGKMIGHQRSIQGLNIKPVSTLDEVGRKNLASLYHTKVGLPEELVKKSLEGLKNDINCFTIKFRKGEGGIFMGDSTGGVPNFIYEPDNAIKSIYPDAYTEDEVDVKCTIVEYQEQLFLVGEFAPCENPAIMARIQKYILEKTVFSKKTDTTIEVWDRTRNYQITPEKNFKVGLRDTVRSKETPEGFDFRLYVDSGPIYSSGGKNVADMTAQPDGSYSMEDLKSQGKITDYIWNCSPTPPRHDVAPDGTYRFMGVEGITYQVNVRFTLPDGSTLTAGVEARAGMNNTGETLNYAKQLIDTVSAIDLRIPILHGSKDLGKHFQLSGELGAIVGMFQEKLGDEKGSLMFNLGANARGELFLKGVHYKEKAGQFGAGIFVEVEWASESGAAGNGGLTMRYKLRDNVAFGLDAIYSVDDQERTGYGVGAFLSWTIGKKKEQLR